MLVIVRQKKRISIMPESSKETGSVSRNLGSEIARTPGPRIPFTRACTIWPAIDFLDNIGAPTERFLKLAGIPLSCLDRPESLVPLHLAYSFLGQAARAERLENLGLVIGQQTSAYEIGSFGELLRETHTVYEYVQKALRMIGSLTSGERFWLTNEGERVRLHHYLPGKAGPGHLHADLYSMAITLHMLRNFAGNQWNPQEVCLYTANELKAGDTGVFRGVRTAKGQAHTSLTIPKALLWQVIPSKTREAQPQRKHQGGAQQVMPDGLVNAVETIITLLLEDGCPEMGAVAESAGMSMRTFQRRLGEIGTSYSSILQRIRMQLAVRRLADDKMAVNEIAASLGYRDPANFTRAFRNKTGVSPQQYRSQLNNAPVRGVG